MPSISSELVTPYTPTLTFTTGVHVHKRTQGTCLGGPSENS